VCTHVDDLLFIGPDGDFISQQMQNLSQFYETTINESPTSFLGISLEYDESTGDLKLSMPGYTRRIVDEFLGDFEFKIPKTPAKSIADKFNDTTDYLLDATNKHLYMSIVGSLLYLTICTRPDIYNSVHELTQHMQSPSSVHLRASYRVLHFLSGTIDDGIILRPDDNPSLEAWADASYASHLDRKSHHGLCFRYGRNSGCFFSASKKQAIVALSSTEAEYVGAAECCRDVLFFRSILKELHSPINGPTIIYQDNKSTITFITSDNTYERSKHIDIRHHYIRQQYKLKQVSIVYVSTTMMIADILTKSLDVASFTRLRVLLLGLR
jgi:hypothetical protein